jgi:bis(5'-nucleosyl)-tetraphosphatase (symmetrical)
MSTYILGDLQGCHQRYTELTARIRSGDAHAELILVGDIVNRGPDSLAMLRAAYESGNALSSVLGNHDLNLLAVARGIRKPHASDTLSELLAAPDREDLLDWLRHRPLAIARDGHLIVHAGVLPQWSPEKTLDLAREVELALQGPGWITFLQNMYGSLPAKWDDGLRGADRLRCIVNALTRMRYCTVDGSMDFSRADDDKAALLPWFDVPGRLTEAVTVVFGHWSARGLVLRPNLIGLDTGCVWGGKLTAVRLEDRALFQVDCPQYQKPGE